jgi:hypothetical protein
MILPRQNPLRLEALELPGSCPKASGICERFWSDRMPHSSYGLRLLMRRRQASSTSAGYQRIFASLARRNTDVEVARGCMISREPFRQLLSEINDSQYDDYLSRPPW